MAYGQILGQVLKSCNIVAGSYKGNGQYGSSNPVTLTFDFEPKLVIVKFSFSEEFGFFIRPSNSFSYFTSKATQISNTILHYWSSSSGDGVTNHVMWGNNYVKWWANGATNASSQFNTNGINYFYVAIG